MEELFLNKGPESDLSLLGKAWTLDFLIAVETCFSFFSWAPGSALKKFAAIVNPEGKLTLVNWTLSWPSAWNFVVKLFFEQGFNKLSDSFGTGRQAIFFPEKVCIFSLHQFFLGGTIGLPRILARIVNLPNIAGVLNNLENLATIATLDTNQDTPLLGMKS